MAAPATAHDFLALVHRSGVLDERRFAELFPDPDALPDDPSECAAALVEAGLLTAYQSKQLLAGKSRGFRLGSYRILQPLGQGGMGLVFLAEHPELNRKVAVKVLPAAKARDGLALQRFYREARAAAALDHPNIVRLHDINQGAGVHFLVMEYVEGTTLQAMIATGGPLPYAQAARYLAQAAAGLQHAHEKGFVHRDIKPANLMVTPDGTVKILDMGLARAVADKRDDLTALLGEAGDVAGTADYVSPEQALGEAADARSDVYSLGATFHALLTGRPPFAGTIAQILMQHQMQQPKLAKLRAAVPPALANVVAKMLAKRPRDRYQTAGEVIDALAPWLPVVPGGDTIYDGSADPTTESVRTTGRTSPLPAVPGPWWKRVLVAVRGWVASLSRGRNR